MHWAFFFSDYCRWKRHTQVGDYRISTIGNYCPRLILSDHHKSVLKARIMIEENGLFETMVYRTSNEPMPDTDGCGCKKPDDWDNEIETHLYKTAGEAQAGHEATIEKYLKISSKE